MTTRKKGLTIRIREEGTEQRPVGLNPTAAFGAMLLLPANEAQAKGPVQILISRRELQVMMKGRTIDLHRTRGAEEGGLLVEGDKVVWMERHLGRWGMVVQDEPSFILQRKSLSTNSKRHSRGTMTIKQTISLLGKGQTHPSLFFHGQHHENNFFTPCSGTTLHEG